MKAAIFRGTGTIEVGERPDPQIQEASDAVVRVVRGCVCGSDLWYYRGINQHKVGSIGHEYIGVVESVGADVVDLAVGDFVIAPFTYNDGTCPACRAGFQSNCAHGGAFGNGVTDGGQGEKVRAPFADATLVKVPNPPEGGFTDAQLASFTALSDVACTGYHAAVSAGVKPGDTVAVVGDGAVGLSAVLAARKLGAARVIALSRNPARQAVAKEFGATDIVQGRGAEAVEAVLRLTDGAGVDAALECVGTDQSIETCAGITRAGGMIGAVGVPLYEKFEYQTLFWKNIGIKGGVAPARQYIPELLDDVLAGRINPGLVFDFTTDLDHVADAYAAMDERRAIKSLLTIGQP
ncbi:threonine dehydrogenase-like Zn-dependent dehydrogenase [Humibacillus xanthopallidus]|uniref:Threonine dehydrogenase-like Zn-dependent dehydrogenase n=1 Tax=Humibacillus xanthopallidus TaxID=412689 RepID=A0A543PP83_9MICO|nr:alcohol dehydrogenase catalytic domain-containing protein [Humibacillus xanthopallidus]TQN45886.1 threonine dehydrogenase-like Zn-dependent dehydrogenase [Humibacillus xanthopallidus]